MRRPPPRGSDRPTHRRARLHARPPVRQRRHHRRTGHSGAGTVRRGRPARLSVRARRRWWPHQRQRPGRPPARAGLPRRGRRARVGGRRRPILARRRGRQARCRPGHHRRRPAHASHRPPQPGPHAPLRGRHDHGQRKRHPRRAAVHLVAAQDRRRTQFGRRPGAPAERPLRPAARRAGRRSAQRRQRQRRRVHTTPAAPGRDHTRAGGNRSG